MLLTIGDLVEELIVDLDVEPRRGTTSEVRTVRVRGGSSANVAAITCERAGAARFVGQVGADPVGRSLVDDLQRRGVDVHVRHHGSTGVTVGLRHDGYVTTLIDRGVASELTSFDENLIQGVEQIFISGRALLNDPLASVIDRMLSRAGERRVPVTLTPVGADELPTYGSDAFSEFVRVLQPDAVVTTARDHAALGLASEEAVDGAGCTIIRDFDRTLVLTPWGAHESPFVPDVSVRDRGGADDGFVAGFLESRATGAPPIAAVDVGHRVAALVMARVGPTTIGTAPKD